MAATVFQGGTRAADDRRRDLAERARDFNARAVPRGCDPRRAGAGSPADGGTRRVVRAHRRGRPATTDPTDIPNWLRLDDRLTTSGQPDGRQLAALKALGVDRVVNLALHAHEKALADEAGDVAALGTAYVHIPVPFDAPTDAHFDRFRAAMQAADGETVHVHCIVNARVSAFLYRYRRDILGHDEPAARAAMERIWRPGGVWAAFVGDDAAIGLPHRMTP